MHILLINNSAMLESNDELLVYRETGQLFYELSKSFEVENFHFRKPLKDDNSLADFNLRRVPIKITAIRCRKSKFLSYLIAYFQGIRCLLHADFLYLFYPNSFSSLIFIAIFFKKPYALYIRGEEKLQNRVSRLFFKRSMFNLTISPSFTSLVKEFNPLSETIMPMISYKIDDLVEDRKYKEKKFYNLLFVGRLEASKGIFDLINALNILYNSGCLNWSLNLVGDGVDALKCKGLVIKYGLGSHIQFKGSVFDKDCLRALYKESDLFILPTHHEGFPRVLYEAMLFGTPILTTFVGAIPYLMVSRVNCFEIKAKDINDLSDKIKMVLSDYENLSKVALKATDTIRSYLRNNSETHIQKLNRLLTL